MFGPSIEWRGPLLDLRDYGVAFGGKVVLQGLALQMHGPCLSIMGHAGAGKSTLLRTLAGRNDAQPELRVRGEARYLGRPLGSGARPWLVEQKARLLLSTVHENMAQALPRREEMTLADQQAVVGPLLREALGSSAPPLEARVIELPLGVQRCLAIARGIAAGAALVMVDEPTAGLSDGERRMVLDLLRRMGETRGVLLVTHDRGDVRRLGGDIVLLVDGHPVEQGPVEAFFSGPKTAAGRRFVETGTCYFDGEPDTGEEDAGDTPREHAGPAAPPPSRYLHWVVPGRLLGMPRPGIVRDLDDDLRALQKLGVTVVVCLEETRTVPDEALARFGMQLEHFPIEDMGAPSIEAARAACGSIEAHLAEGSIVAVHCLGGAGRTGLILAAFFIHLGSSALEALERVRRVQPRFVQSDAQVDFLGSFELQCRGAGPPRESSRCGPSTGDVHVAR